MFGSLTASNIAQLAPNEDGGASSSVSSQTNFSVPLYLHQQADIIAMRRLETETVTIPATVTTPSISYKTALGVLADMPGAGKSFTMLAHVAMRPVLMTLNEDDTVEFMGNFCRKTTASMYNNNVHATVFHKCDSVVNTNLFVVPRATLVQWITYARDMARISSDDMLVVKLPKDLTNELAQAIVDGKYKYVFFTERSYCEFVNGRVNNVMFQRLIIDEADSLYVVKFKMVNATFKWCITATHNTLLSGTGQTAMQSMRRLFQDNYGSGYDWTHLREFGKNLVVRSTDDFVKQSLQLPPYSVRVIVTRMSPIVNSLRSYVPLEVMEAVNACDINSAVLRLGCETSDTEDGLISAITSHYRNEIEHLTEILGTAPTASVAAITHRIQTAENKIKNIGERVKEVECCPISLDDIVVKAVTPCCHNAFEFEHLLKALQRINRCPMCKSGLLPQNIIVNAARNKSNEDGSGASTSTGNTERSVRPLNKVEVIRTELIDILRDPASKVLIFSSYNMENVIQSIRDITSNSLREVKGSSATINKGLTDFREGRLRVLLLNAQYFGAGLNLECATHVITMHKMNDDRYTQLIGRAQRPGRTTPLSVINVRYDTEAV
jgi:predicted Zn-ribbon and HTH transcriptional regulator